MARRPASITQADVARAIRAAKQAGAAEVELRVAGGTILIRIASSTAKRRLHNPGRSFCDRRDAAPSPAPSASRNDSAR